MQYKVRLTDQAIEQIQQTVSYISNELLEPKTAGQWADFLQKEIDFLNFMPSRYPLTDEEPWRSYGIHKMTVKNFLVYYLYRKNRKLLQSLLLYMDEGINCRRCRIYRCSKLNTLLIRVE